MPLKHTRRWWLPKLPRLPWLFKLRFANLVELGVERTPTPNFGLEQGVGRTLRQNFELTLPREW